MKHRLALFLTTIALGITLFCSPVMAEGTNYSYLKLVNLTLNQKSATVNEVVTPLDQPAFAKNGRTLVPFRFLAEALGAEVSWDAATSTAGLTLNGREVKVTLGSKTATINGQAAALGVPAESIGGRTFIPLRFVSEALGAKVDYDAEAQAITVTLIDTTGWISYAFSETETLMHPADWEISGEITDALTVTSPSGTEFILFPADNNDDAVQTASSLEESYKYQGYDFITTIPLEGVNGTAIVYSKLDLQDTANSDVVMVAAVKVADRYFVMDLFSKLSTMDSDMSIIDRIFDSL